MLLPKCYKTEMSKITIHKNIVQDMIFLVEITQGWYRLRILSTCCWKTRGWMADTKTITLPIVSTIFVWIWRKTVKSLLCTPSDSINENQEELADRKKKLVEENAWGTGDHKEGGGAVIIIIIAKDCLLTGQEQACTRITWLFVCLVVTTPKMAQYTGKWWLSVP